MKQIKLADGKTYRVMGQIGFLNQIAWDFEGLSVEEIARFGEEKDKNGDVFIVVSEKVLRGEETKG